MTKEETMTDIALRRRIVQVLAEILADKYDCTIKVKFRDVESNGGGGKGEFIVETDHRTLCRNGT